MRRIGLRATSRETVGNQYLGARRSDAANGGASGRSATTVRRTRRRIGVAGALLGGAAAIALGAFGHAWLGADSTRAETAEASRGPVSPTAPAAVEEDPREVCAALAPEDPYEIDPDGAGRALDACRRAAAAAAPDGPTLLRLARSAIQADSLDEAVTALEAAAACGECEAWGWLGDAAWHGRQDADAAETYYERGKVCGDRRSAQAVFAPEMFAQSAFPELMEALYRRDVERLNQQRFLTASYVPGLYEMFGEQYPTTTFSTCWGRSYFKGGKLSFALQAAEKGDASSLPESIVYEQGLPLVFALLHPEAGSSALEDFRETARRAGNADVVRLAESSECGALLPHRIVEGIEAFAAHRRSLYAVARERLPQLGSLEALRAAPWSPPTNAAPSQP